MSEPTLTEAARALLAEPVIANLATIDAGGTPHVTPVWVDIPGGDVVIKTVEGRAKVHNMRRSAKVAVSVVGPRIPSGSWPCRAPSPTPPTSTRMTTSTASPTSTSGVDVYPMRPPGERRLKVTIRPDRVLMQPADR